MLGIKNKFRTMLRIDEIQVWLNEKEEKLDLYDKYHNKRKLSKYFLFVALFVGMIAGRIQLIMIFIWILWFLMS